MHIIPNGHPTPSSPSKWSFEMSKLRLNMQYAQRSQRRPSLNSGPDIMSADIFTKPFNFVAGGVSKRR